MAFRKTFVGFSTYSDDVVKNNNSTLYGIELIKRDLLNEFYTRKGERVMLPAYGFIAWDLLFAGLTAENRDLIINDANRLVNKDSRVELLGVDVAAIDNGIIIALNLYFKPYDLVDNLELTFRQNNN